MDGDGSDSDFWINQEDEYKSNLQIGYNPIVELKLIKGDAMCQEMFTVIKWSRTGRSLVGFPFQMNEANQELCYGSIINFNKHPIR